MMVEIPEFKSFFHWLEWFIILVVVCCTSVDVVRALTRRP